MRALTRLSCTATLLLMAVFISPATAQIAVSLEAAKDNTLYQDTTGTEANGAGQHFFAGRVAAAGDSLLRRGLIAFDIAAGIPAGAIIVDVELVLYMSRTISGATDVSLHTVDKDWAEGDADAPGQEGVGTTRIDPEATWIYSSSQTDLWTTTGGDFNPAASAVSPVDGPGFYSWSSAAMVADVQAWLDNPAGNFGWLIKGEEVVIATAKRFDSRVNSQVARRPVLNVALYLPDTTLIAASKDNTLYEDTTGSLSNGAGSHFFAGRSSDTDLKRGLVAFDVADFTLPGATILDAELILNMSRSGVGAKTVSLHRLTTDWGERASDAPGNEGGGAPALPGDATWTHAFTPSNPWVAQGGDFAPAASATTSVADVGSYTWNDPQLTADVQAMLDNPLADYGWLLLGDESGGRSSKRFDSRHNSTEANRPVLRVVHYGGLVFCLVQITGDVNESGSITSADIIYLVGYVFKGTDIPRPCEASGDVNCTGFVTSADIIYLVNFVFKGDSPPCDVCTLIPGTWNCQ